MANLSNERFASNVASVNIPRSKFVRDPGLKTSMNAGLLYPIYFSEVLPGDSLSLDTSVVARMSTMLHPVMDDCYMDIYYFFVPNRLVWTHWREFCGENNTTYWEQPTEYEVPQVVMKGSYDGQSASPEGDVSIGNDLWDYFGLPTVTSNSYNVEYSVSALPFRAYSLIWNDWFRSEVVDTPISINLGDGFDYYAGGSSSHEDDYTYINTASVGGKLAPVNKFFDYFTGALPSPQKGPAVEIPLLGEADVYARNALVYLPTGQPGSFNRSAVEVGDDGVSLHLTSTDPGLPNSYVWHTAPAEADSGTSNVYADLTSVSGATINQLREAFAIQKLYERDARGGSRYIEMLKAHFGVTSPDARLQRPEYLGGKRIQINVQQIAQTNADNNSPTPLANLAAYSQTSDYSDSFTHSFVEHGMVIGVACIRTAHTYQQGINRYWSKKRRFDFYYPALANIGEQPILQKEIYATGKAVDDDRVFGFQEAWADYRYQPSIVTGSMRSGYRGGSLDSWHYADYYNSQPYLNSEWLKETKVNVDRTLAVTSAVSHQFIADFKFNAVWTRPMPMYSIPGLIDHN